MTSRRDFIRKTASASLFASLASTQTLFAAKLEKVASIPKEDFSGQYLLDPNITYFNHASIGTIPKLVHEAHISYLKLCESNPWLYTWSDPWIERKEEVRNKVAEFSGCKPNEIVLTHNTTGGMNLLASGLPLKKGDEVLYSSFNHSGARVCWEYYAKSNGYEVRKFEFKNEHWQSEEAIIEAYVSQVSSKTRVVVIPHIDNIIGALHPVKHLAKALREKGVQYVAIDGAQSVGLSKVNLSDLGVDFYATSPHKWIQSPKGTGFLYIKEDVQKDVKPLIVTWGQKRWTTDIRRFEDFGTRDLPEVLSIGDAIEFQRKIDFEKSRTRRQSLKNYFKSKVESHDEVKWMSPNSYGDDVSIFAIEVTGRKANEFAKEMYEKNGFVFRPFESETRNTVRISLNIANTTAEINRFFDLL
ncbi:MAG: aminotransferase class V-fold PLP-dependent enzyme [Bacteroidota bacterium]